MNDYSMGCIEVLAWIRYRLDNCQTLEEYKKFKREIDEAWKRLSLGTRINFAEKLKELSP